MKMAAPKKVFGQATKLRAYTANGNRFTFAVCNPLVDALSVEYKGRS